MSEFSKIVRDRAKVEFRRQSTGAEHTPAEIIFVEGAAVGATFAAEEALNFAMKLCSTGMTLQMLRRQLHNRLVEITGQGERA